MQYRVPRSVLAESFAAFRRCGCGERECQVLWVGPWNDPFAISKVVHPLHRSHRGGFEVEGAWLNRFWNELAETASGVRAQVHTHPGEAFHSSTDDAWPIVHTPGFLSLVIPDFGFGEIGFADAFLAELGVDGRFREVSISSRLVLT